ncbi:hypothetical protein EV191_1011045 [Tamaricihabitans halophyticus]|uniref:Uncharacterized protein n=1 Tax=Tamaricihabitans halophyticus TaxID=1262583 RepID=A0A4R2R3F5_9PSEU|nr:hypothetical protein [Tamaricihabitans halophyticus]TCP57093.1 hypothetical protein EV191_1011045 [Tamaricihabitans halophyticus]
MQDTDNNHTASIDSAADRAVSFRRAGWVLFTVSAALSVLSMAVPALIDHPLTTERGEIRRYVDVFEEANLPTWWSTGLLVLATLTHLVVAVLARARRAPSAWAWFGSAVLLGALSLDDHTMLHERLDRIGERFVTFDGFPFYWLIPGVFAGALIAIAFAVLAVRLRGAARWCIVLGCAVLLASALGGEVLQGVLIAVGESGPLYVLTYHAEELGENIGTLLLLAAAAQSVTVTERSGNYQLAYTQHSASR